MMSELKYRFSAAIKYRAGIFLLWLAGICFCGPAAGQAQKVQAEFDLIENLSDQWLVYDCPTATWCRTLSI
jgi:hypothetical protein